MELYTLYASGQKIVLVDIPGFGDSVEQNAKPLRLLAEWLSIHHHLGGKISGIIYVHSMTNDETNSSTTANFRLFESIVGEPAMRMVTLVTTMWDNEKTGRDREFYLDRETYLKENIWLNAAKNGAIFERSDNTVKQIPNLLEKIVKQSTSGVLTLQKELVIDNLHLSETAVGREFIENTRGHSNSAGDLSHNLEKPFKAWTFRNFLTIARLTQEMDAMIRVALRLHHWSLPVGLAVAGASPRIVVGGVDREAENGWAAIVAWFTRNKFLPEDDDVDRISAETITNGATIGTYHLSRISLPCKLIVHTNNRYSFDFSELSTIQDNCRRRNDAPAKSKALF